MTTAEVRNNMIKVPKCGGCAVQDRGEAYVRNVAGSSSGSEPTPWQRGSLGKRTRESEWESSLPEQGKRRHAVSPADAAQTMTKAVLKMRQIIAESGTTDPHEMMRQAIQVVQYDLTRFTFGHGNNCGN